VLPETNVAPEKSKLCQIIEENLPAASIVSGARKFFREDLGMEYINQVTPSSSVDLTTAYFGRRFGKRQSRDIRQVQFPQRLHD
jgi:hypothetical protein